MKGITKQDKDAIRDALMAYCENFPAATVPAKACKASARPL